MTLSTTADIPQGPLDAAPMTGGQILVVGLAVLLATLDGYDLLGMAFVAPVLSHAWAIDSATLGFLLATSLVGMAIGSLAISPLADITGRKPMTVAMVALMALGSLLSAFCLTVPQLAACRILTGIGIGAMVPLTTAIASEFASARQRPFAIALTTIGMPLGSISGGLVAAFLLARYSWPSVFLSGAVFGLVLLAVIGFALPESPAFLVARRPAGALEKLNHVLSGLGRAALPELPPRPATRHASYRALFTADLIGLTLGFSAIAVLVSTTAYYLITWLPQLITQAGFPPSVGPLASAVSSVVGMVSGLLFGYFAARSGPARLAAAAMIGFGLAVAAFGFTPPILGLLVTAAGACGFFLSGCTGIFYAAVSASFPALSRVSGIGFAMGVGRVFSILGPGLAGWLFAAGLGRGPVSLVFATGPILAGLLLLAMVARRPAMMGAPDAA